jgi:hypothetical protein
MDSVQGVMESLMLRTVVVVFVAGIFLIVAKILKNFRFSEDM